MISAYFNKNVLESNEYIDNLVSNYKYIDNLESKINIQEDDYNLHIDEINSIDLETIKETFQNKNCLHILQKELLIIKLLSKYALQTNNLDNDFVIKCIKICFELSEILRQKISQKQIKITNKKNIQRCSYKFCNFKDSCGYNYNKNLHKCYQDHYVHNMVSADLYVLLEYIQLFKNDDKLVHNKEILKSINTLSFVINHMEKELKSKCLYQDKSQWEKYHFTKKIVTKIIKNNKK